MQKPSIKSKRQRGSVNTRIKWALLLWIAVNPLKWIDAGEASACEKAAAGKTLLAPNEQWIARGRDTPRNWRGG